MGVTNYLWTGFEAYSIGFSPATVSWLKAYGGGDGVCGVSKVLVGNLLFSLNRHDMPIELPYINNN